MDTQLTELLRREHQQGGLSALCLAPEVLQAVCKECLQFQTEEEWTKLEH